MFIKERPCQSKDRLESLKSLSTLKPSLLLTSAKRSVMTEDIWTSRGVISLYHKMSFCKFTEISNLDSCYCECHKTCQEQVMDTFPNYLFITNTIGLNLLTLQKILKSKHFHISTVVHRAFILDAAFFMTTQTKMCVC